MRFVHKVAAFLISTGGLLASTAGARAQTCNNYSPTYQGFFQYQVGNNSCSPLTNVVVTLAVTQDIVVASSTQGYNGFGVQLDANGPSSGLTPSQLYWQQFVITADTANIVNGDTAGVDAFTQQWSNGAQQGVIYPSNPTFMGPPSAATNGFLTIPAGTKFTWKLNTDAGTNYVNSCTYSATDSNNITYQTVTENIPQGDRAPIYSVNFQIVGYNNGSYTWFQS